MALTEGQVAPRLDVYVDEQEDDSFPASDPHSDWAGPPTWLPRGDDRRLTAGGTRLLTTVG